MIVVEVIVVVVVVVVVSLLLLLLCVISNSSSSSIYHYYYHRCDNDGEYLVGLLLTVMEGKRYNLSILCIKVCLNYLVLGLHDA